MERVHHRKAALIRKGPGKLQRLLKVQPVFNQFNALSHHGPVLFSAVAEGNDDDGLEPAQPRGHANTLAMIASCGRHHPCNFRLCLLEPVHIDQRSAQFESADRRVVFVLDPGFGPRPMIR